MTIKPWTTVSSRPVYENKWMSVREDIAAMPDGRTTIYGVVTFGHCVGIVPVTAEGEVILVRQYRYVFGEDQRWEIPTGGVEPGEAWAAAAQRELMEEAGVRAGRLIPVSDFYTSKSVCYEIAHIYIGEDLSEESLPPDETESFEVRRFPLAEALQMVLSSEIRDAMSVVGILLAARQHGV
ncbi:MAG: NUDIX hydrolase [Anaerolineae bacterium]|uniref:NUDIX hydrolase n=1 Tax=Candidatus Amarolinea dominans TaxID=3140696 RepID=UPI0031376304|nr:NUDIX hydrolase [Anaerolineae bacterium]